MFNIPKPSRVLALVLFLFTLIPIDFSRAGHAPQQVCFSDQCFEVEVSQTLAERMKGLQFRKSLEKNAGMLFIFSESGKHSFWMKDTFIPLDMIWLDRDKKIVTIVPNILPCTTAQCPVYAPDKNALYVLEINAGVSIEKNLKVGDQAIFR